MVARGVLQIYHFALYNMLTVDGTIVYDRN